MYYRKTKKGEIVRVHLVESPQATTADPLYIIDGIATRSTKLFLSLTPSDIKTIKIINTREKIAKAGLLGKYGIVIVETHKGNIREPLDSESKLIKGLEMPQKWDVHNNPAANKLIPDFRSTLYWNPSVKTDANGKATVEFYSSDDIGKIKVRLDGLTTGGMPFTISKEINVIINPLKN
jgi:hypothetical protein